MKPEAGLARGEARPGQVGSVCRPAMVGPWRALWAVRRGLWGTL